MINEDFILRVKFNNNTKMIIKASCEDRISEIMRKMKHYYGLQHSQRIEIGGITDDRGFEFINDINIGAVCKSGDVLCVYIREVGKTLPTNYNTSNSEVINYDYNLRNNESTFKNDIEKRYNECIKEEKGFDRRAFETKQVEHGSKENKPVPFEKDIKFSPIIPIKEINKHVKDNNNQVKEINSNVKNINNRVKDNSKFKTDIFNLANDIINPNINNKKTKDEHNNIPKPIDEHNNIPKPIEELNNIPKPIEELNNIPKPIEERNILNQKDQDILTSVINNKQKEDNVCEHPNNTAIPTTVDNLTFLQVEIKKEKKTRKKRVQKPKETESAKNETEDESKRKITENSFTTTTENKTKTIMSNPNDPFKVFNKIEEKPTVVEEKPKPIFNPPQKVQNVDQKSIRGLKKKAKIDYNAL
ncbi:hypothetical protein NGRA_1845 [Nosema granulosis]|uniref:Ubiquitin-like domain-containing protein n=1 Tax=Nosema granulosis TaxID=83296 RepID=A0A9P6GXR9_9MICR|nr:hypothetical protein NGRA_1845 [Nosema granulosis]